jgi:hypothetical protein
VSPGCVVADGVGAGGVVAAAAAAAGGEGCAGREDGLLSSRETSMLIFILFDCWCAVSSVIQGAQCAGAGEAGHDRRYPSDRTGGVAWAEVGVVRTYNGWVLTCSTIEQRVVKLMSNVKILS